MPEATTTEQPPVALQVVPEMEVRDLAKKNQLSAETADELLKSYQPFFAEITSLLDQASRVEVTDATQVTMIRHARELRLKLREQRVAADKVREQLKAESLRRGKAIDGVFALLKFKVEPIEERLLAAEQFAERAEQARKDKLREERSKVLIEMGEDPKLYAIADMEQPKFEQLVEGIRAQRDAAAARAKKEADDRAAKEKADAEERERIRLENEQLKRQASEREAKRLAEWKLGGERHDILVRLELISLGDIDIARTGALTDQEFDNWVKRLTIAKTEREAAEKRAAENVRKLKEAEEKTQREIAEIRRKQKENEESERREREASEKAEAEKRRIEDAERQRKHEREMAEIKQRADAEAAERKRVADELEKRQAEEKRIAAESKAKADREAAAPDREKLEAMAAQIRALQLPPLQTDNAKTLARTFATQRNKFADWLDAAAAKLTETAPQSNLNV